MKLERINYLIDLYFSKTISTDERKELLKWYRAVNENHSVYPDDENLVRLRMLNRLYNEAGVSQSEGKKYLFKRLHWIIAAASVILCCTIAIYIYQTQYSDSNSQLVIANGDIDFAPGNNIAKLVLADGKEIELKGNKPSIVVDKSIRYEDGSPVINANDLENRRFLMSMITPKGGMYQVKLSDGTRVWLNSETKLIYPNIFDEKLRSVELEGEAYFEVAKSITPFVVKTKNQKVLVHGTSFNISAYNTDEVEKTTLISGKVSVLTKKDKTLLKPNQTLKFNNGDISIQTVVGEDAISWKNNIFLFDNISLEEACKKLNRWYNVEFVFENENLRKELIFAVMSKLENISSVLENIEKTKVAKFNINKDKISIMNY